ncbi:MAG TPA: signal peptidase I [Steroidobacteraceae bacterium]|jgi:signal peptidase I
MMQILTPLAALAIPVVLIAVIDDWFLRPRRRIASGTSRDGTVISAVYYALPLLLIAALLRLLMSERLDFSVVLVCFVAVAGAIWLLDHLLFEPLRRRAAAAAGRDLSTLPLPVTVDYARSFFPVAVIVLLVRSFIFEPYRIPSDSMMPTLVDGDFILVNKYAYGLRLPVLDKKVVAIGDPQRGDVVVFHYPPDPAVNFIKRVVGLPGDHVRMRSDQLIINGVPVPLQDDKRYDDGCYHNMRLSTEQLGNHTHQTLSCLTPDDIFAPPGPTCKRRLDRNYECIESTQTALRDHGDHDEIDVPPGQYLMVGDNRDNSYDGRYWGFVPEDHLVGKATRIWFNWDLQRSGGPVWSRIGRRIE